MGTKGCSFCNPKREHVIYTDGHSFMSILAVPGIVAGHVRVVTATHEDRIDSFRPVEMEAVMREIARLAALMTSEDETCGYHIFTGMTPWLPRHDGPADEHLSWEIVPRRQDDGLFYPELASFRPASTAALVRLVGFYQVPGFPPGT